MNQLPPDSNIRKVLYDDLPALKGVIDTSSLFPSEFLDDMIASYFHQDNNTEFWVTYVEKEPVAVAYFAPERLTNGTYNLYLIAVHADHQGKTIGKSLIEFIEQFLKDRGERILLVETSGLPSFERTRAFYLKNGYTEEARIREFYAAGEDKVIFWKALSS
ncbi:GNAT family N-acetyltransferase [Haliscomenobacter sp.]|uniref:GNAT family N-acetyltransferase n=1 Tax=Haliscomenobacter sp. TaxID=2717303 RepID=UPI003BA9C306